MPPLGANAPKCNTLAPVFPGRVLEELREVLEPNRVAGEAGRS